jgi:hypothetical protein
MWSAESVKIPNLAMPLRPMTGKIVFNSRQSFLDRLPAPLSVFQSVFSALPAESARNPLDDDTKDNYLAEYWV